MPSNNWDEALNFGVKELDQEHQNLVTLVDILNERAEACSSQAVIGDALDELVAEVGRHIEHENRLLDKYGYHESRDHAAADRKFFRIFEDVRHVFHDHGTLNAETRDFIRHLVVQHIIKTDKPLRDFFRGRQDRLPEQNPYIHWLDSFGIGLAAIDEDHKVFIDLVNRLKDAIDAGAERDIVVHIVGEFVRHAKNHCAREENLLAAIGYPGYERHKADHSSLNGEIFQTYEDLKAGKRDFGRDELLVLIKEWIIRHVLFIDMKMKSFLEENAHI